MNLQKERSTYLGAEILHPLESHCLVSISRMDYRNLLASNIAYLRTEPCAQTLSGGPLQTNYAVIHWLNKRYLPQGLVDLL